MATILSASIFVAIPALAQPPANNPGKGHAHAPVHLKLANKSNKSVPVNLAFNTPNGTQNYNFQLPPHTNSNQEIIIPITINTPVTVQVCAASNNCTQSALNLNSQSNTVNTTVAQDGSVSVGQ